MENTMTDDDGYDLSRDYRSTMQPRGNTDGWLPATVPTAADIEAHRALWDAASVWEDETVTIPAQSMREMVGV